MSGLGVHFAITAADVRGLRAADDALDVVAAIEERWDEAHLFETDKAWDALTRCFGDGTLQVDDDTDEPLELVFFGGEPLVEDDDRFVHLLAPAAVARVAAALAKVTKAWLRERYDRLDFPDYPGKSDRDFEYTWASFGGLPAFFAAAAAAQRSVIFTVDQ